MAPVSYTAGAGAGMAGVLAGQPLDTVRVRLQQRNCLYGGSAWRVAQSLMKREGIGALFKGSAYPLTTTALQVMAPPWRVCLNPLAEAGYGSFLCSGKYNGITA